MARQSKAWFRASKGTWYTTLNGEKVSLGVKGEENEAAAIKAWHRLLAGEEPSPTLPSLSSFVRKPERNETTVKHVLDGFLADADGRVSVGCLSNYNAFLLPFAKRFGTRLAEALTV